MNYYWHHLGDYAKKTGHLSIAEHGAYLLMMQAYYATEKPLPTGRTLYRLLRAETAADRKAIDSVVEQFWNQTPEGLTNDRADREMAKDRAFIDKQRASGRASAAKRWGNHNGNGGYNGGGSEPIDPVVTKTQPPSPSPSPSPKKKDPEKNCSAGKTPPIDPPWLAEFKILYPERSGDPNWRGAIRAASARIAEGHQVGEFLDGARRYHEFCRITETIGTQYVKQASTFLGPAKPFLDPWNPPVTKADIRLTSNITSAAEFMRRTEQSH